MAIYMAAKLKFYFYYCYVYFFSILSVKAMIKYLVFQIIDLIYPKTITYVSDRGKNFSASNETLTES